MTAGLCAVPVVSAVPGIGSTEHHTLCQDLWTEGTNERTHCFMNENLHLIHPYNNEMRQIFLTLILQMSRLRLRQATICLLLSVCSHPRPFCSVLLRTFSPV